MHVATQKLHGLILKNHTFKLPVDYNNQAGRKLTVFAREVVSTEHKKVDDLPWLVFFQGGPGFQSPRPFRKDGWIKRAVKDYRVLLLDQRGTGLSTPVNYQTIKNFSDAKSTAEYLLNFRADNIIRDAEEIRKQLVGEDKKWTGLGQSYGGFCLTHYLSHAPEGLEAAIITGGIPPLNARPDDVYRATYKRVIDKNKKFYQRFPDDATSIKEIVEFLKATKVTLPSTGTLTPRRFQQLGIMFGMQQGMEQLHFLIEDAFIEVNGRKELNYSFLRTVEELSHFETNPIYVVLHEAIYCQNRASAWSADRVKTEFSEFDENASPFYFTGEMIYPWMFDDFKYLATFKESAEILAQHEKWPVLYNVDKLRENKVPVVAAVYYDDMYVETGYTEHSARNIGNCKLWITNEYDHDGIRQDGSRILDRLLQMLSGEI